MSRRSKMDAYCWKLGRLSLRCTATHYLRLHGSQGRSSHNSMQGSLTGVFQGKTDPFPLLGSHRGLQRHGVWTSSRRGSPAVRYGPGVSTLHSKYDTLQSTKLAFFVGCIHPADSPSMHNLHFDVCVYCCIVLQSWSSEAVQTG